VYALPESERESFVDQTCGSDSALRAEVAWVFDALRSPEDDRFLEQGPLGERLAPDQELSVPAPRNYQILQPLGEGGMGLVYLAQRNDGDYVQKVALKFLSLGGLLQPTVVAQFLSERRILAELSHPNIAHLIDGGALPDGRPFLAMEYVDGICIDEFCANARLSVAQKLQLFLKVCAAVQFAHQALIIHRDIKPGNILVTAAGEPKLLDFGIARLIRASIGDDERPATAGIRPMTLAYASPEQIAGKSLSVATDIFSLGVVLYELLTLKRPWRDADSPLELIKTIGETEPPPPSAVVRADAQTVASKWPRYFGLRSDLDLIVLKALRKEPAERYASVQALATDIENFLQGRPVQARRANTAYRARKFIQRNKLAFATALGVLLLIVAFAADRQLQLQHTRDESRRAQAVASLLTSMFKNADPTAAPQPNMTARQVLDRGAERLLTELKDQPSTRAALLLALGDAYYGLRQVEPAQHAYEESLALLRKETRPDAEQLVDTLSNVGVFTYDSLGKPADGERLMVESLTVARARLAPGDPSRIRAMTALARDLAFKQGATGEAESLAREASHESEQANGPNSAESMDAAASLMLVLEETGHLDDARILGAALLPRMERQLGLNAAAVLNLRNEYGRLLVVQNRFDEAEHIAKETLARIEGLLGAKSPRLFTALNTLADARNRQGDHAGAVEFMRRALEVKQDDPSHDDAQTATLMCNLAFVLVGIGQLEEAATRAAECVRLRSLPSTRVSGYFKGHALYVLGTVEAARKHSSQALEAYERAFKLLKADTDRAGSGLTSAVARAITETAVETHDFELAHRYADVYAELIGNGPDSPNGKARHALLRAMVALAEQKSAEAADWARQAWEHLSHASVNCKNAVSDIRKLAATLPPSDAASVVGLDTDPPCAR
jgi:serine/threonine-protein kinase